MIPTRRSVGSPVHDSNFDPRTTHERPDRGGQCTYDSIKLRLFECPYEHETLFHDLLHLYEGQSSVSATGSLLS